MSLIHFQGTNVFEEFRFDNLTHTVVGGVSGANSGYNIDPAIGSIDPLGFPDVFGTAVSQFFNNPSSQFQIQMLAALNAGFWTVCKIESVDPNWNRKTFNSVDFAFTQPGGFATWILAAPTQPAFLNGVTYRLDWT